MGSFRPWTKEEERFLVENYGSMLMEELTEQLGRSQDALWTRARELGLKRGFEVAYRQRVFGMLKDVEKVTFPPFELGFITGLIDGDGCIGLMKDKKDDTYQPHLTIANTDKRLLDYTEKILRNAGLVPSTFIGRRGRKRKLCYHLKIQKLRDVYALLPILENLVSRKREAAKILSEFLQFRMSKNYSREGERVFAEKLRGINLRGSTVR